jgi:glycosyltransferase involved in cell wall biosynthesis
MARILTLTNWFPPHHFGGYEVLCDDVMTRMQARGHQVEVLCSDERLPDVADGLPGPFPVHRQLKMYWRDGTPWTPGTGDQIGIERANQAALDAVLARFKPDVVSVWHMGALSLSLLTAVARRSIPIVYAICDEWLIYGLELDPWARRWYRDPIRRGVGRLAEKVVGLPMVVADLGSSGSFCFLSEFTMRSTMAASPWTYPDARVIYPGIDLDRFPVTPGADARPWSWTLLYTGRLDARKGTETLLRAMPLLPPEATMSFLGRGDAEERARLEALASQLGVFDRVRFESIERSQLAEAYRSHDCLISPSEWPEPFGMVPLEAMACGTPVVATGVGGSAEYLTDEGNCLLFTPGDAADMARVMARLAADAGLRKVLRKNGWVSAEQFDVERTADGYEHAHLAAAQHRRLRSPTPGPGAASVPGLLRTARSANQVVEPALVDLVPAGGTVLSIGGVAPGYVLLTVGGCARILADPMHLPLRSHSFTGVIGRGGLEFAEDDRAAATELHRVVDAGGIVVLAAANRRSAAYWNRAVRYAWRGWRRRPTTQPTARQYNWSELERAISPIFEVANRVPSGWDQSQTHRSASRLLVGPFRRLSREIVIVARPR